MINNLPSRDSLLALGLYCALVFFPPCIAASFLFDAIENRNQYIQVKDQIDFLEKKLHNRETPYGDYPAKRALFESQTATMAVSDLQTRMSQIISLHRGTLLASQSSSSLENGLNHAIISVEYTIPETELISLLHSIEINQPFIFIDTLNIQKRDEGLNSDILRMSLRVSGYARRNDS